MDSFSRAVRRCGQLLPTANSWCRLVESTPKRTPESEHTNVKQSSRLGQLLPWMA